MEKVSAVIDTSVIVAFFNAEDERHGRARGMMEAASGGEYGVLLLPEYVFDEAVTLALSRKNKQSAIALGQWMLDSPFEFVYSDPLSFDGAWNLFQHSTRLSFTDCFIAVVARERGAAVMSFDEGFQTIAGLKIIS